MLEIKFVNKFFLEKENILGHEKKRVEIIFKPLFFYQGHAGKAPNRRYSTDGDRCN
jgi:hypothetical protein